jgi:CheY-like chemotaxis protein
MTMADKKILVVDDDESNVFLFRGVLEKGGYNVVAASNGEEALEIAAKDPPDLVLTDLLMPGIHGYDLVKQFKENEQLRHIPVIITTAVYKGPQNKMMAHEVGAEGFLEKPVEPELLLEKVKTLLSA